MSAHVLGDIDREPEEIADEWLVTSEVESRVTADGTGLAVTSPSAFSSVAPPTMEGRAVVSSVLSGAAMGRE